MPKHKEEESSELPFRKNDERCERVKIDGKECSSSDVKLYIVHEEERVPICGGCWNDLADSEWETVP